MSIGVRKKVVGLIGGGFLTLLGVFLPVGGASAASINPPPTARNTAKDIAKGVVEQAIYDALLKPVLDELGTNFTADTELESAFGKFGIQTFVAAGGAAFYLDKDGNIADNDIRLLGVKFSNNKIDAELIDSFEIKGTSKENGEYLVKIDTVLAQTIDNFWSETPLADVKGITLKTGEGELTGEIMYAGGFSMAFLDGEFVTSLLTLQKRPIKAGKIVYEENTPEPLTMLGAAAAIGYGAILKQKSSKMKKS